jgi:type I restriction enzyme S subunit
MGVDPPSDWRRACWGDLLELRYGKPIAGVKLVDGPVEVFGTNGPTGSRTDVPQGTGPTVVIGRKGAYRGVRFEPFLTYVTDTAIYTVPRNASTVDTRWAFLVLSQADINGLDSGSAIPSTRREDVYSLPVVVPPLAEQRAITEVLNALDDKAESNRRTANAARAVLMQAPPSTGESSPLDQAADFHNGGALTKHATGSGRPILRIKELRAGVKAETPRTDAPVREAHEVAGGDLLFSWSGTLLTTRWCGDPAVLNQHVFRVDPRPGLSRWFVEAWIERHLETFRAIAADKATTMGHIQRHHLIEALVALPPRDEIDALMRTYDPLDHLRMSLLAEAERLVAIRDALLPRLVSGRIRVPLTNDLDEAVEAVLDAA